MKQFLVTTQQTNELPDQIKPLIPNIYYWLISSLLRYVPVNKLLRHTLGGMLTTEEAESSKTSF